MGKYPTVRHATNSLITFFFVANAIDELKWNKFYEKWAMYAEKIWA